MSHGHPTYQLIELSWGKTKSDTVVIWHNPWNTAHSEEELQSVIVATISVSFSLFLCCGLPSVSPMDFPGLEGRQQVKSYLISALVFYCFWSQRKLSCVSFNPLTRFSILTLRLSAPLPRRLTPSSAQESLPHGLFDLGARLFLRMQADSPEPTRPEPSLPEKNTRSMDWASDLWALSHPPSPNHSELTHTHTHTFTFSLACHNKMPPKSLALPSESLSSVTAFGASACITWCIWKCQAHWVRQEQFKKSWEGL